MHRMAAAGIGMHHLVVVQQVLVVSVLVGQHSPAVSLVVVGIGIDIDTAVVVVAVAFAELVVATFI